MSETFFIKKTAFDDASSDVNERDANSIVIGPGELNGPGGIVRDSDLKLYGFGSLKWGEGIEQNILRLMENFACPAKELGDHLPCYGSPIVCGSPEELNSNYDPGTHPIMPKDEKDLGMGNGITIPYEGQQWFNTTNKVIYTWTGSAWTIGGEGEVIVDADQNLGNQYQIFGSINPSDGAATLPGSITDVSVLAPIGWNDDRYVNKTGDTMSGVLDLGGNRIENIADPSGPGDAVTLNYANNSLLGISGGVMQGSIIFPIIGSPTTHLGDTDGLRWTGDSDYFRIFVEQYGLTESSRLVLMSADNNDQDYISFQHFNHLDSTIYETLRIKKSAIEPLVPINFGGNRIENVGNPNSGDDAMPRSYADTRYINTSGDTMTGGLTCNSTLTVNGTSTFSGIMNLLNTIAMGNNKITNLGYPTATNDAASKSYVDTVSSGKISGGMTLSTSGYIYFTVGGQTLYLQYGYSSAGAPPSRTVFFPVAFPSVCRSVVTLPVGTNNGGGQVDFWGVDLVNNVSFRQNSQYDGSRAFYWMAIGY